MRRRRPDEAMRRLAAARPARGQDTRSTVGAAERELLLERLLATPRTADPTPVPTAGRRQPAPPHGSRRTRTSRPAVRTAAVAAVATLGLSAAGLTAAGALGRLAEPAPVGPQLAAPSTRAAEPVPEVTVSRATPTPTPQGRPWAYPDGAAVVVPAGDTVVLDRSADVRSLTVAGTLILADADLELRAGAVTVQGRRGRLVGGSPSRPLTRSVTVTLTSPGAGLRVTGGASLALHGARGAEGFARLAETAGPGDRTVRLTRAAGLRPGDEVVLGATGTDPTESERVRVRRVEGTTVTLASRLEHRHLGVRETYGGRSIEMRAPVGLLDRNVTIRAEGRGRSGAGVEAVAGASVRLSGVRLQGLGGPGRPAVRLAGVRSGTVVEGSSVVDSGDRCVVLDGVRGVRVERNVALASRGGCYVASRVSDTGNVFDRNLALLTLPGPVRGAPGGPGDGSRPASFWFAGADNRVTGNEAGGAVGGYGMLVEPPQSRPTTAMGYWRGNVTHSNSGPDRPESCVFFKCGTGLKIYLAAAPGDRPYGAPRAVVHDHTSYANEGMGVFGDNVGLRGLRTADVRDGVFGTQITVDGGLLVGGSRTQGRDGETRGIRLNYGRINVRDTVFARFGVAGAPEGAAYTVDDAHDEGVARQLGVSAADRVRFVDALPARFDRDGAPRDAREPLAVLWDLDGSLGAGGFLTYGRPAAPGCRPVGPAVLACPRAAAPSGYGDGGGTGSGARPPSALPPLPPR